MKRPKHPLDDNSFIATWIIGAVTILCIAIFFALFINSYVTSAYEISRWL